MSQNLDAAVLIGRFQPFHVGHLGLLRAALDSAPQVVVVLGSAFQPPSPRNPFSAEYREQMIRAVFGEENGARSQFLYQRDFWNTTKWAQDVVRRVQETHGSEVGSTRRIALVGHRKDRDATTEYLAHFPDWTYIGAGLQGAVDATQIREALLDGRLGEVETLLPNAVRDMLRVWQTTDACRNLGEEIHALRVDREFHGLGPFITADPVVVASNQVLLSVRGARPGMGNLALPGGLVGLDEKIDQSAKRWLASKTGLLLPQKVQPTETRLFSHPGRSLRGRVITHACRYDISTSEGLCVVPRIVPGPGVAEVRWIPIADLPGLEDRFFEDHFHILDQFFGLT